MNEVLLHGKTYVKAIDLAKDLGYTTDYIGQLCRSAKVEAEMVGRSWYVNPESLKAHKKSRYRSTKEKTQQAVRHQVAEQVRSVTAGNKIARPPYAFESDSAELFPQIAKPSTSSEERVVSESAFSTRLVEVVAEDEEDYTESHYNNPFHSHKSLSRGQVEYDHHKPSNVVIRRPKERTATISSSHHKVISRPVPSPRSQRKPQAAAVMSEVANTTTLEKEASETVVVTIRRRPLIIFLKVVVTTLMFGVVILLSMSTTKISVVAETGIQNQYKIDLDLIREVVNYVVK